MRFLGDNKHYFHASNDDVSSNIKVLSDAIKEGKSVIFTPLEYGLDLKLHSNPDGICYIKPLRMIPKNDFYYVMMAKAWLISECYIKYPNETLIYLEQTKIDTLTYNKAISKI